MSLSLRILCQSVAAETNFGTRRLFPPFQTFLIRPLPSVNPPFFILYSLSLPNPAGDSCKQTVTRFERSPTIKRILVHFEGKCALLYEHRPSKNCMTLLRGVSSPRQGVLFEVRQKQQTLNTPQLYISIKDICTPLRVVNEP